MHRSIPMTAAGAAAVAVLLAGCSSSSTNGKGSTKTPAGSSSVSTSAAPPSKAQLAAMVLQPADVPSGWTASAADESSTADDEAVQAKLTACLGVANSDSQKVATATSRDYDQGDASISSEASSYRSSEVVDRDAAALVGDKAEGCFETLLKEQVAKEVPAGGKVDKVDVTVIPHASGQPDNVVAAVEAQITISASGQSATVYADVTFIRGKQVEAQVEFIGLGARIPEDVRGKAVEAVAGRVA